MPPSPELIVAPTRCARGQVDGDEVRTLSAGWQAACSPPGLHDDVEDLGGLNWLAASVPGTAAGALRDAGLWRLGEPHAYDEEDWWFRTSFDAQPAGPGEEVSLCLDGIATVAEVYLNGERVLQSDSMFAAHTVAVGERLRARAGDDDGAAGNELVIHCRALAPLLAQNRRPRARWRTRLVPERNLRFFRTMLLGRAPGFAPGPAAVGPWREVRLKRRRRLAVEELTLRPRVDGENGVLSVLARLRPLDGAPLRSVEVELTQSSGPGARPLGTHPAGMYRAQLALSDSQAGSIVAQGELVVPDVERWWPHTHGDPVLHDVRLLVDREEHAGRVSEVDGDGRTQIVIDAGRIGFRELAFGSGPVYDLERDGLDLHVNGVRVFARGAVWTPIDMVDLASDERDLQATLMQVREAGMNMLRLPGTSAYEASTFHDLCDELGILVWQDFMFANFDYPLANEHFRATVTREAADVLGALGGRPSLVVVCGNSEVEQQVTMLGLDPALARCELFDELLPELVRESGVDALYVPSAPCGGELPFRTNRGIANYYGVGSYRRPLEDVRRAGVRFAAECLAFSNVPDREAVERLLPEAPGGPFVHDPAWKVGVPRDEGVGWDFDDVRDHYLQLLFGVDASQLRRYDHDRYLELSRMVTGEVMAEVFGEWRRAGSPCGGGLVLWLTDLLPGAGWGVIDHRGVPKLAYHHLKRALAPVAIWTVEEGLGGVVIHVANDRPQPLTASLRVALYRDGEVSVEQTAIPVELEPHSQSEWNVDALIGYFVDAAWAFRFGPPAQDAIVVSLERDGETGDGSSGAGEGSGDGSQVVCQTVRFPAGRPLQRESPEQLGLALDITPLSDGEIRLEVSSRRLLYGVHIDAPGFLASDDGFCVEPGGARSVTLSPIGPEEGPREKGRLGAVNLHGYLGFALETTPR